MCTDKPLWRTQDIFESNECWETTFHETEKSLEDLKKFGGTLGNKDSLLQALDTYFAINRKIDALLVYAKLKMDEDKRVSLYQGMVSRVESFIAQASAASAFFAPELLALPKEYLDGILSDSTFKQYHVFLSDINRQRPHILSAEEEKILAMTVELEQGPETIFEMLSDADMKFPSVTDKNGKTYSISQASYIHLLQEPDRDLRKAVFDAYYSVYAGLMSTIPAIYASSVKFDVFNARVRNFASAREQSLFASQIPVTVYDNLIEQAESRLEPLNRYLKINARRAGLSEMYRWDMYIPAVRDFALSMSFEEALELVADSLAPLGEDYQAMLRSSLEKGWIDPFERPGKHSGAYSWGTYDSHPYVLMNYQEDLDSILTLAHELGHSMHTYFSNTKQPFPTSDYSLFVAEVASTVNEVLVLLRLLDVYTAPEQQAFLLDHLLHNYLSTLFRQTLFARFEKETHAMAERGEALTGESLNALYAEINKQYYPAVEPCDAIAMEWMRIPHFYSAFYVYVYATGFSAATAIAQDLYNKKPGAAEGYRAFLSTGSSLPPIEALKLAGIDMESPEPVSRALDLFESLLSRYEKL